MILSSDDARALMQRALSFSKADEAEVSLGGGRNGNLRFACNRPTTSGAEFALNLNVSCMFGQRVGSYSTNDLCDEGLRAAVAKAEKAAGFAPQSPEYMPRLGQQSYTAVDQHDPGTMKFSPESRAKIAGATIRAAQAKDLMAAGYWQDGEGFTAFANTKGGFGYHQSTGAGYSLTVRTPDGTGSGWAAGESYRAGAINTGDITERAIRKALQSRKPEHIEPGTYEVILEPSAAGDMLNLFRDNMDRRAADEGRNFFAAGNNATRKGEKLFGDDITIYSDPTDPTAPSTPWGEDGLPLGRTTWVDKGVVTNLYCGRYWAQQKNLPVTPYGANVMMKGGTASVDQMIASTKRGLLVTSFWYIRQVDPKTILYTGLTRDGVFLIENGKITTPVINLRWNESPVAVFKNIQMMSGPERVVTREGNQPMLAPAMKVKEFHFTSTSGST